VSQQAVCLQRAADLLSAFQARQAQARRRFLALQARNKAAFFAAHSSAAARRVYVAKQAQNLFIFTGTQKKALHDFFAVVQVLKAFCLTLPTS